MHIEYTQWFMAEGAIRHCIFVNECGYNIFTKSWLPDIDQFKATTYMYRPICSFHISINLWLQHIEQFVAATYWLMHGYNKMTNLWLQHTEQSWLQHTDQFMGTTYWPTCGYNILNNLWLQRNDQFVATTCMDQAAFWESSSEQAGMTMEKWQIYLAPKFIVRRQNVDNTTRQVYQYRHTQTHILRYLNHQAVDGKISSLKLS